MIRGEWLEADEKERLRKRQPRSGPVTTPETLAKLPPHPLAVAERRIAKTKSEFNSAVETADWSAIVAAFFAWQDARQRASTGVDGVVHTGVQNRLDFSVELSRAFAAREARRRAEFLDEPDAAA